MPTKNTATRTAPPPVALAHLSPEGTQWIIDHCPLCGAMHFHGAGPGDPLDGLGHRAAHCLKGGGHGYVLVAAATGVTDRLERTSSCPS